MIRRVLELSLHADPLNPMDGGAVGGQQIFVRELAQNIQQEGYGVDVLTVRRSSSWPDKFSLGHLGQVQRIDPPFPLKSEQDWVDAVSGLADSVLSWISENGRPYQVIHSHFWVSGLVAAKVAAALHIPWVHTPYKMAEWARRPGEELSELRAKSERSLLTEADAVVVSYLKEGELVHQSSPEVPIYVVPPAVDPAHFFSRDAGPILRGLSISRRPVIYLGRLEAGRGLLQALECLTTRELPEDFRFLVIGGHKREVVDGRPENPTLRALAERLGSHVIFLGGMPHRAIATYLGGAEVVVAPNQGPTLGMAVLEAEASGVPVVGTRVTGIQDWIAHGEDGFLVPTHDMEALWDHVMQLWNDPALARKMGKVGQDKVHRYHTSAGMVEQLARVYQEVTESGGHQMGVGY